MKTEQFREKIAEELYYQYYGELPGRQYRLENKWLKVNSDVKEEFYIRATQILEVCKKDGLAFVVEDEDSPQLVLQQDTETIDKKFISGYKRAQQDMKDAGFRQFEEIEVL